VSDIALALSSVLALTLQLGTEPGMVTGTNMGLPWWIANGFPILLRMVLQAFLPISLRLITPAIWSMATRSWRRTWWILLTCPSATPASPESRATWYVTQVFSAGFVLATFSSVPVTAAPLSFRLSGLVWPGAQRPAPRTCAFSWKNVRSLSLSGNCSRFMRDTLLDSWSSTWTANGFFRTASAGKPPKSRLANGAC
jgi:hypothetical protein